MAEEPREKTLHELNREQREVNKSLRELNEQAAEAAKKAVSGILDGARPDGRRTRKNLRPIAE